MNTRKFVLMTIAGVVLLAPLTSAKADPWKDESGNGRHRPQWDRHDEPHRPGRERGPEREWRHEERERRSDYDRRRAYQQGREEGYRDATPRNPVEAIGRLLGR